MDPSTPRPLRQAQDSGLRAGDSTPRIIGDRYELQSVVGEGGYGVVYRGVDRRTQQAVAVKVLSRGAAQDPDRLERMVREQQAMAALAGTGVVSVLDLCELPTGQLCLVMEWLDGGDLEHQLAELEAKREYLSLGRLLEIVSSVANTLDRAHQMGIVHRDIKPANIFLTSYSGTVRLLDFGLSRMKWSKTLTQAGMVMGSPSYIAPETWRGESKRIDHQADLYALGVIVFRALTGELPFGDNSLVEQMKAVTTAPRPSVRAFRPELPRGIDAWARKALAINPADRFKNGRALYNALVKALEQGAVTKGPWLPLPNMNELQSAVVSAFGAATSLLKRFASPSVKPASASSPPPALSGNSGSAPTQLGTASTSLKASPSASLGADAAAPLGASASTASNDDAPGEDRKSNLGEWLAGAGLDRSKALKTGLDMLRWLKGAPTISLQPPVIPKTSKPPPARDDAEKDKRKPSPGKRKPSRKRKGGRGGKKRPKK